MPEQITNNREETWLTYMLGDRGESKKGLERAKELDKKDGRKQSPFSWVLYFHSTHQLPTDETFEILRSKAPMEDKRSLMDRLTNRKPARKPAIQKIGEETVYDSNELVRMVRGAANFDIILPEDWSSGGKFEGLTKRHHGGPERETLYKLAQLWYLCKDGVVEWKVVQKKMKEISDKYGIKLKTLEDDVQLVVEKLGG